MIRLLASFAQDDAKHTCMDEFGFGDQMFICPINVSASSGRAVYLPKGNWYYY